ncbi:PhnD/SsuA/transferrin family substrate-binding protein [Sporosarcina sp. FSL K6-3457]|uniref:PhnD/SsuA/transferrin family substrate-binding protein n=1 Tax=Sporosarcina sp. FSL K6-3457 TaxID=2978204 RepID=UPI0030F589CE
MKKNLLSFLTILFLVTVLAACSSSSANSNDQLTMVWYPNESGNDLKSARDEIGKVIEEVTGKKVEHKLTTDYAVAIETIANGNAQLAFMGAQGYIEAKNKNNSIEPLIVPSGKSGTIDDAVYYSWLAVKKADAENYKASGEFAIDNIVDSKFSFVSSSSTSGFKVPSSDIVSYFTKEDKWKDLTAEDLMEGGPFFKEVLYGDSHQGSAVNLLSGRADVAAFCDTCVGNYIEIAEGEANKKGSIYKVKADAAEPFNTVPGEEFTLINVTPVLNAPFAANKDSLSDEDFKKIQELLTSDDISNNEKIFVPADSEASGLFTKSADEKFVIVEDSWFNPIRELSK